MELYSLHLFAGAGGGILGDLLLGHKTIGAVEIEAYPRKVLLQRQIDGCLPRFPIWDDVTTFRQDNPQTETYIENLKKIKENHIISCGYTCQDISTAGKGKGITGERSGLWKEFARIIGEIRPRFAFVENSPALIIRGLDVVLGDLASMGYDSKWGIVSAENAGAPHKRKRIWILAYASKTRGQSGMLYEGNELPSFSGGPTNPPIPTSEGSENVADAKMSNDKRNNRRSE